MSRILLTDAEQLASNAQVSVLAAPHGGVTLRVVDPTGATVVPLTREQAEAVLAALRVTLETDAHAEPAIRLRQTAPRSESISSHFARRAGDLPEDTYADRLASCLCLREERFSGSKAVG